MRGLHNGIGSGVWMRNKRDGEEQQRLRNIGEREDREGERENGIEEKRAKKR